MDYQRFCTHLLKYCHLDLQMKIIEKDIIIIGGGPSGLACALEASMLKMDCLVLEKGLLVNSIYNFPTNMTFFSTSQVLEIGDIPFISHTDKPSRKEALEYYRRVAESYNLDIRFRQKVKSVKKDQFIFEVSTQDTLYKCQYLVVATGYYDTPNMLNVPGEQLPKVKHYYDDAHPYIGQDVAVVGAANSACDVALETYYKGARVTMIIKDKEIYEKVKYWIRPNIINRINEGSIKAYFKSQIKAILPDKIIIETPEGEIELKNDYVLAMTGYRPNFPFLESLGISLSQEELIPSYHPESLESNVSQMYLAGVILAGNNTSKLFIENTRHHGKMIMSDIHQKLTASYA